MKSIYKDVPETAVIMRTYKELEQYVQGFSENRLNLLGIVGAAGQGKSQSFKRCFGRREYLEVSGNWTPFKLYEKLHAYQNLPVVIDDADTLFENKRCVPLLKTLCDTVRPKTLKWESRRAADDETLPSEFTTTSRVAILCNTWNAKDANMRAVADRGTFIHFVPSVYEVHEQVQHLGFIKDPEIFELIGKHLHLIIEPSMRYYHKAVEMKQLDIPDWQGHVLGMLNPHSERRSFEIVSLLMADPNYRTEQERVEKFKAETGLSSATYYRYRDALRNARGNR